MLLFGDHEFDSHIYIYIHTHMYTYMYIHICNYILYTNYIYMCMVNAYYSSCFLFKQIIYYVLVYDMIYRYFLSSGFCISGWERHFSEL